MSEKYFPKQLWITEIWVKRGYKEKVLSEILKLVKDLEQLKKRDFSSIGIYNDISQKDAQFIIIISESYGEIHSLNEAIIARIRHTFKKEIVNSRSGWGFADVRLYRYRKAFSTNRSESENKNRSKEETKVEKKNGEDE